MDVFENDPRNPSTYNGIVSCHKCGEEYESDDMYHECKEVTDEDYCDIEDKENECGYCGELSEQYFCNDYCRKSYVSEIKED